MTGKRSAADEEGREETPLADEPTASKRPPHPKRKVAILMGYCGSAYQGMQMNKGARTIEQELFDALVKDGLISKENAVDPKKISWMRACRTDKGVHAAGQVVSVKMLIKADAASGKDGEEAALEATVERLNALLPKDIRVFAIRRAANSFHAKERTDSRFYDYLLPTYALAPASAEPYLNPVPRAFESRTPPPPEAAKQKGGDSDDEAERLEQCEAEEPKPQWVCHLTAEQKALIAEYRIDADRVARLRTFMSKYVGSHKFHNFTIGKAASDPTCRRNILAVTVSDPFLVGDMEWVSIVFHGQSFMLHQIRKMVGLAILALRLNCDLSILDRCFEATKVNIPKAPSLGLLLDKAIFAVYNEKFAGARDSINFDEFGAARRALKNELIYPEIHGEEQKYHRFMGWLNCNDEHASEFGFLVPFINRVES